MYCTLLFILHIVRKYILTVKTVQSSHPLDGSYCIMSNVFTFNIRVHTWSPYYTLLTKYTSQFRGLPHRVDFRVGVPASVSSNQSSANSQRPLLLAELDVHSATPHDIGGGRGGGGSWLAEYFFIACLQMNIATGFVVASSEGFSWFQEDSPTTPYTHHHLLADTDRFVACDQSKFINAN
jgi:hypothetical protein